MNQTDQLRPEQIIRSSKYIQVPLWGLFIASAILLIWNITYGLATITLFSTSFFDIPISIGFRIDILSTIMLAMITLLGVCIGNYSIRYLDGERKQNYFSRYLLLVVGSASLLVTSSNLIMFYFAWLGTSLSLHKLLTFYADRPLALMAARKKFIISRIGDLALLLGIALTYHVFNTFEFEQLFTKTELLWLSGEERSTIGVIGFLFALGAMTKSAQFPLHFWLPETMETPTPVSALMHAGVINAGGFLMIRLSPILEHASAAHLLLGVVGATTAVFAGLVMITQNHLKSKLAYSTISQMGMMLFACGLGAYSLALFHIVAHSFYKAYAFLSTGMQIEESRIPTLAKKEPSKTFLTFITLIGFGLILTGLMVEKGTYLPFFTYGTIILLGIVQNLANIQLSKSPLSYIPKTVLTISALALAFIAIEYYLNTQLSTIVPNLHTALEWNSGQSLLCIYSYLIFCTGFWMSSFLPYSNTPFFKRLYCYLWNGGYFSSKSTALLDRFPGRPKALSNNLTTIPTTEHANA